MDDRCNLLQDLGEENVYFGIAQYSSRLAAEALEMLDAIKRDSKADKDTALAKMIETNSGLFCYMMAVKELEPSGYKIADFIAKLYFPENNGNNVMAKIVRSYATLTMLGKEFEKASKDSKFDGTIPVTPPKEENWYGIHFKPEDLDPPKNNPRN